MPDSVTLLSELPESRATGETHEIYEAIKRLSGVPMVALIYRHLATIPGALEWAWQVLEPSMRSGRVQQCAWDLARSAVTPPRQRIARAALRLAGLSADDERAIGAVLDAYNRANPVNMVALSCLALRLDDPDVDGSVVRPAAAWQPPPPLRALPAMVDPAAMSLEMRDVVALLADRDDGREPSPLWPSLYRHLAHWPAMLGYAAVVVLPEFDAIDRAASDLRAAVRDAAGELAGSMAPARRPAPSLEHRRSLQLAIGQFTIRIPEMVVVGSVLQRALPSRETA